MADTVERRQASPEHEVAPLPPEATEGYLQTNGIRLHYVAAGTGPLVVLLHGFPEFWYSWRFQLPALARAGMRAVALDMRGYNLSDKPEAGYDIATLCDDVRGAIEALGEQRADVIGHDWGGVIAWAVAIREFDYVRRLVVLAAPHPAAFAYQMRSPRQLVRSAYVGFFQLSQFPEEVMSRDDYALLRRQLRKADPARAWLTDEDIDRFIAAISRPGALHAALEYYRRAGTRGLSSLGPARVIEAPTLVLWGDLDPFFEPSLPDHLEPWVRDVNVRHFSAAGHWLNQQAAEDVNDAIIAFLRPRL